MWKVWWEKEKRNVTIFPRSNHFSQTSCWINKSGWFSFFCDVPSKHSLSTRDRKRMSSLPSSSISSLLTTESRQLIIAFWLLSLWTRSLSLPHVLTLNLPRSPDTVTLINQSQRQAGMVNAFGLQGPGTAISLRLVTLGSRLPRVALTLKSFHSSDLRVI